MRNTIESTLKNTGATGKLVMTALGAALVFVATSFFKIPTIATQGYVHLGDAFILISVLILGRRQGAVAAAVGSGMADLIGGYPHWVIWTFLIKGIMAFLFGTLVSKSKDKNELIDDVSTSGVRELLAYSVSGAFMVAGYYAASSIMYGSLIVPLASVPWNIVQAVTGAVLSHIAYALVLRKTN